MATILVRSPADGATLGEVHVATPAEIAAKVAQASAAFRSWRAIPIRERVAFLRRLRSGLLKARGRIAELVAREQGKPLLDACLAEIFPCVDHLTFLIHDGPRIIAPQRVRHRQPFLSARRSFYHFQPYGVWAVITPWNYPFCIPFLQAATLLFGGNTVILKPSPLTPLTAELVLELFRAAGAPVGSIDIVHGGAGEGEALVRAPEVRAVLFTGGPEGGRKVLAAAANGLKKVVLELGGKDAAIVLNDANLEHAARGIAWGAMLNAGQTCASVERVYVERGVSDRFKKLLAEQVASFKVANPLEPGAEVGPMTAEFQLEKVKAQVEDARARGARIAVGGAPRTDLGPLYYSPTVIEDAPHDALVMREETFGPVVAVETVEDVEEALREVNANELGLTASLWTRDRRLARSLAPRIECGVVSVSSHLTSYGEPNSAWGGFRSSGLGRTHGEFGLRETLQVQYIDESFSEKPEMWWLPHTDQFRDLVERTFTLLAEPSPFVRAATLLKMAPGLGYLARHAPLLRMLPGFWRYLR